MRMLGWLAILGACSTQSSIALTPDPRTQPPLGVGLVQRYSVVKEVCGGGFGVDDGGCDDLQPTTLAVTAGSSTGAAVSEVDAQHGTFVMTGLGEQAASVAVTGDGIVGMFDVMVSAVAATTMVVSRSYDSEGVVRDVASPVQVFTGETIAIAQTNVGSDGQPRSGVAPIQIAPGPTAVGPSSQDCACFDSGQQTGAAVLSTPLAMLTLDVVDMTTMADFAVSGATLGALQVPLVGLATATLYLDARDAMGRSIVGVGPDPTVTIADTSIAALFGGGTSGSVRWLTVQPQRTGMTTIDLTWGSVHKTFMLVVS